MRKGVLFHWDEQCQNALDSLKRYLLNPPVLVALVKGHPLILYIATQPTSIGALLAQHNDEEKEVACYYLSHTLVGAKINYSPIEKLCLALVFYLKKLWHYMLVHLIQLIARVNVVRYVLNQPALMGCLGKWVVIMMEFDITYVPQKAIKGQALADFLVAHPIPDNSPLVVDLPDEDVFTVSVESPWELYFNGASRIETDPNGVQRRRAEAGLVFKTPQGKTIYHSFSLLKEECLNNEAEYEALIFGLLLALSMDIRNMLVYGDSQLVVRQINGIYEVHKLELVPYYKVVQRLVNKFEHIQIAHIPHGKNASANTLAKLTAVLVLPDGEPAQIKIEERWLLPAVLELVPEEYEVDCVSVMAVKEDDWRKPLFDYFNHGILLNDHVERRHLQ
jgi:ribonuclease HI